MKKTIRENIGFITLITIILLVRTFIVTPVRVNGDSMDPTLKDKSIMLLDKTKKYTGFKRMDIIVIKYDNEYLIKRIIGLPGEKVRYENNKLYINNKEIEDSFSHVTYDFNTVSLKSNEYFVMGDNRKDSLDSRLIGPIDIKKIKGSAYFTLFPLNKFGIKK